MSVYKPKGQRIYWMEFVFQGQRIRESTKMPSITRAKEVENKRKRELQDGSAGIRKRDAPKLFTIAYREWMEAKSRKWSPHTLTMAKGALAHLIPAFGKKLLVDVEGKDIARYQKARLAEGVAGRTVNIEVGCLRSVLKRSGLWARIQPNVEMLPERDDVGHALSGAEEGRLLEECGRSRSRIVLPFVLLLLETGARYNTIRTLQWKSVDFANGTLKLGQDKTRYSSYRTVPLSPRGLQTIQFWAERFPARLPEHFVFPREKCGGETTAIVYDTDPSKPIGDIKEAWEHARKRAGLENVRIHDLRHSSASRMITAGIPLPVVARILGWSSGTMAKMSLRYGHFSLEEMRSALESIGRVEELPTDAPKPVRQESGKVQ